MPVPGPPPRVRKGVLRVEEVRLRAAEVSVVTVRPPSPAAGLVLAHGAGAGIFHPFMEDIARALAAHGIATLRFQFPYMEAGRRFPDPPATLEATWAAAAARARRSLRSLPLFAGGKSMGGRILAAWVASGRAPPPGRIRGLCFLGFPLHRPGSPSSDRGRILAAVDRPMWFGQGTRDVFCDLSHLRRTLVPLGERATLHVEEGADHGFDVRKRDGREPARVIESLAGALAAWIRTRLTGDQP